MMQATILQHQQQQAQQRQQQEQQLQWDAQHLLLRTEQERQQRLKDAVAAHVQRAAPSWVRTAEPSAEVAGLTSKLLVDLRHQQNYDQQQQQQAEQQHQISAGVEAAIATAPPAATREIQYAIKLMQDWYPGIGLDGTGWHDLADFLAQPTLVRYQQQAT